MTTDQSIVHPQDGTLVTEKQWNDIETEAEILGGHCHFVHNKSDMDCPRIEPEPVW